MLKKTSLLFCMIFILTFSFVSSAQETTIYSFPQGYDVVEQKLSNIYADTDYIYHFHLLNSSTGYYLNNESINCTIFIANHTGTVIFNSSVSYKELYWEVQIPGMASGLYPYGLLCLNGMNGASLSGDFEVTLSGEETNLGVIFMDIFLVISSFCLIILLSNSYKGIDFKKKENKIITSHNGHWGQTFIKNLGYGLMKNSFLWYYSLGWLILFILKDMIYRFNSLEIYTWFLFIFNLYSFGFFLVIVIFIGILINHFNTITDIIKDLNIGLNK